MEWEWQRSINIILSLEHSISCCFPSPLKRSDLPDSCSWLETSCTPVLPTYIPRSYQNIKLLALQICLWSSSQQSCGHVPSPCFEQVWPCPKEFLSKLGANEASQPRASELVSQHHHLHYPVFLLCILLIHVLFPITSVKTFFYNNGQPQCDISNRRESLLSFNEIIYFSLQIMNKN